MHPAGVNVSPPVTEPVGVISFNVKSAAGVVLQYGDRIILSFQRRNGRKGSVFLLAECDQLYE